MSSTWDIFFKETLCNYMMNWKDHTKYMVQSGDHNCTHRKEDSLYNPEQHFQHSLVKHMKINGLQDDYIEVKGNCPEVGYCALPLFGLEADWGRGGVGIMIWGGQEGGYLEDGEGS